MVEHIWVKHPDTGGLAEVPRDALAQLRQSGWEPLSAEEVADHEQAAAAVVADAEDDMRSKAAAAASAEQAAQEEAREAAEAALAEQAADDGADDGTEKTEHAGSRRQAASRKGNS